MNTCTLKHSYVPNQHLHYFYITYDPTYNVWIYIYTYIQNIVSLTYIHNVLDQKLFMHVHPVWILCAYSMVQGPVSTIFMQQKRV